MKFYAYDFEILYPENWCVSFKDLEQGTYLTIRDDVDALEAFTKTHKEDIFIGFNNENYDKYIWDCILQGWNPFLMSIRIIDQNLRPYTFYKKFKYKMINYDILKNLPHRQSLKMCEGNLGLEIKESTLILKTDSPLTEEEWESVIEYNKVDCDAVERIFEIMLPDFESKLMLIKMFKLPISYISKSNAQLTAIILEAHRTEQWKELVTEDIYDKDYYEAPENLKLGKYNFIKEEFGNCVPDDFKGFSATVANAKHAFGTGGLHGEGPLHYWEGLLIIADVTSYYPEMMELYQYLSRNVARPELFKEIKDLRIKYKKEAKTNAFASKMSDALKLVINTASGAQRAQFNDLFDPRNAKGFCVTGQLFLVDLIEKIEPYLEPNDFIQSNTDGIAFKLTNLNDLTKVHEAFKEWEERTGFTLEVSYAKRTWQKDVNNYLLEMDDGDLKFKGGYMKSRKGLTVADSLNTANAIVVNEAIKAYFVYELEPEYYIKAPHDLIDFQYIARGGTMYKNFYHFVNGEYVQLQRVNRVFASTNQNNGTLYKMKKDKITYEKVASLPDHCLIINDNIIDNTSTDLAGILDLDWYIAEAWRKIKEFKK